MTRLLAFFILSLVFTGLVQAQRPPAQHSRFGVKAGASITSFVGQDVSSGVSPKYGFHAGFIIDLGLSDAWSIQPELLYSMKGVNGQRTYNGLTAKGYQTLHYVDFPFLLKAKVKRLFFEAGPQVSLLIEATETGEFNAQSNNVSNKAAFNSQDFGYALGLGYQPKSGLLLGMRYNGGLSNITKPIATRNGTLQQDARNSAFQAYAGYMFGGK